ncbi:MAG TPA: glycosyltransferase family 4 protein [Gemmatimonadaceae bacterium]|nr:glycosyltransferase family 4 protein [Gemmatimonadaceae bacterium]
MPYGLASPQQVPLRAPPMRDARRQPEGEHALHGLGVALVTEYYYPHLGGVCEHVHFLAREARRRGCRVDIITSRIAGAAPAPHVIQIGRSMPVYANGSMARITVGAGLRRRVREVLRRGRYDLVHVHSPNAPTLPLLAIEEAAVPVVGTFHTNFADSLGIRLTRGYMQRRLDRLAAVIAVSPTAAASCRRYYDVDATVIPNGVDVELFHPGAPRPPALPGDAPTILFLGRFDPRNGLDTLIHAFRRVRTPARRARLVVVGDGPLRPYYRRLADGDPDIHFVGAVLDGRAGYYAHSDVYACPTTRASFGITLLEAMACGTAVVCSDIEGFRDVVVGGREALMTPCGGVAELAGALERLLDDEVLRARMGAAGRETALRYAWPDVAERVLAVYARVLGIAAAA